MGYHNALAGADLHEPSRLRILNSTGDILLQGDLVYLLDTESVFGVSTVVRKATFGDDFVGYVDDILVAGEEGTVVLIGRVFNSPVDASSIIQSGDHLKSGTDGRLERDEGESFRIGTVITRIAGSTTMDIFMNSTNSQRFFGGAVQLSDAVKTYNRPTVVMLTSPAPPVAPDTFSVAFDEQTIGFTNFGIGINAAAGNGSFELLTSEDPFADTTSRHRVKILQEGTYEITPLPMFHFGNTRIEISRNGPDLTSLVLGLSVRYQLVLTRGGIKEDILLERTITSPDERDYGLGNDVQLYTLNSVFTDEELSNSEFTNINKFGIQPKIAKLEVDDELSLITRFQIIKVSQSANIEALMAVRVNSGGFGTFTTSGPFAAGFSVVRIL